MNLAQKVAVNTTTQVGSQVVGVFVSLLTLRVTTGYLGVDQFGELAIILTVAGVVVAIADLGIATTLAREVMKAPEDVDRLAGHLLTFRVISTFAIVLATLAVVPALPYSSQTKLALILYLVGIAAWSLASFPSAFFQMHLKLHLQAIIDMATRIFALASVSAVAMLDLGFYALVASMTLVPIVALALSFWFLIRFWHPTFHWKRTTGVPLVRETVSVGVVAMVGVLHFRSDGILLSLLAPARDVGIYSIAYRFVDQSFSLAAPFALAVFPILARLVHHRPEQIAEAINRSFQVLVLGSIMVVLAMVSLAGPLVQLIAGPNFDEAVKPTRILAFAVPFLFCTLLFYNVCIAANRQRALIAIGVGGLVLNVTLNFILIPRYTYNGAAIASIVSQGAAFFGSYWLARRAVDFHLDRGFFLRAGIAVAAAAVAVGLLIKQSEFAAFLLGELTLVGIAYLAGAIRAADLRMMLRREQRPTAVRAP